MKINVEFEVTNEHLSQLFSSAIEGGDPVTTASKGGWCWSINLKKPEQPAGDYWFAEAVNFNAPFQVQIIEVTNEDAFKWVDGRDFEKSQKANLKTGALKSHIIGLKNLADGLAIMAKTFPHLFKQIGEDNIDAPCADIFLQCILFGEEKYA